MKDLKNNKNTRIISDIPFDLNIDYNTVRAPYNLTDINSQETDNNEQLFLKKNISHGKITEYVYDRNLKNPLYESQNCTDLFKKQNYRSHSPSIQSLIYYRPINRVTKNITEKSSRIQSIIINTEKLKRATSPLSKKYIYQKKPIRDNNTQEKLRTIKISENLLDDKSNNDNKIPRLNSFDDNKKFFNDDMTLKEFLMKETELIKLNRPNMQLNTINNQIKDNSDNGYNSYNSETNKTNYTQVDNAVNPYSAKLFFERKIKKIPRQNKNNNNNNSVKKSKKFSEENSKNISNSKKIIKYSSFRQNNNKGVVNNDTWRIIKKEPCLLKNANKKRVPCKIKDSSKKLEDRFKISKIFSTSLTNINTNINAFFYSPTKIITNVNGSLSNKNKSIGKKIKINHSSSDLAGNKCKVIDLHKFKTNPFKKKNNSFSNKKQKNLKPNTNDEDKPLFTIRIKISDLVNQLNKINKTKN